MRQAKNLAKEQNRPGRPKSGMGRAETAQIRDVPSLGNTNRNPYQLENAIKKWWDSFLLLSIGLNILPGSCVAGRQPSLRALFTASNSDTFPLKDFAASF